MDKKGDCYVQSNVDGFKKRQCASPLSGWGLLTVKMSSVQNLRELINERLTAAAEEIFTEFEKTIVQYQEEIDRQRRLLDNICKPEIKSDTTDLLQQYVLEENVLAEENLSNQERNSSLNQEDPEPPQMKAEQEELCTRQEGMQLILVQCKSKCEEIPREIFGVSDKSVSQLDGEIDYQSRLLDINWKPRVMLQRIDFPQQHVCKEGKGLTNLQFCNQEKNFGLKQEDPELPQINEEQEELCTSQQGKQIVLKQETDTFLLTSTDKDSDHSEVEPNSDQLISYSLPVGESPHQEESKHVDSESTRNAVLKSNKSHNRKSSHSNNVDKSSLSGIHRDTDVGRKSVKCDVCGNTFENKFQLKKHHQIHKGVKPYACNACGKIFSFQPELKVHMRIHTGEKPYSCETCGKGFTTSSDLTVHMRTHTGERPYSCETCGKSFTKNSSLTVHMRTHTGEKPYSCETCGKSFRQSSTLTSHMRTHTGKRPYSRERCGKRFSHRGLQTVNMRTHTAEMPYSCETCGKRFSKHDILTRHMRIHTGEKPYSCETCGRGFTTSYYLTVHMRTHTGERPYSCERCGKRFIERSYLTVHMRTHTGERPYSCETCGKSFRQSSNLIGHMRTHTGERPYSCETCGKTFSKNSCLTVHMRTHTGEKL